MCQSYIAHFSFHSFNSFIASSLFLFPFLYFISFFISRYFEGNLTLLLAWISVNYCPVSWSWSRFLLLLSNLLNSRAPSWWSKCILLYQYYILMILTYENCLIYFHYLPIFHFNLSRVLCMYEGAYRYLKWFLVYY